MRDSLSGQDLYRTVGMRNAIQVLDQHAAFNSGGGLRLVNATSSRQHLVAVSASYSRTSVCGCSPRMPVAVHKGEMPHVEKVLNSSRCRHTHPNARRTDVGLIRLKVLRQKNQWPIGLAQTGPNIAVSTLDWQRRLSSPVYTRGALLYIVHQQVLSQQPCAILTNQRICHGTNGFRITASSHELALMSDLPIGPLAN